MGKRISTKKFASNVILSIAAQVISLAVSFVMGLIVPKFIDEYSYAYWQMYIMYAGYVGVLHFGLLDGLVLRYGAYDYDELDKKRIRSQFQILLLMTTVIAVALAGISVGVMRDAERIIFVLVAVSIVLKNVSTYNSYIFQITNRINRYVIITIAQRIVYGITVVILLACRVTDFYWFCIADILGDCVGISIGIALNRGGVYFGKSLPVKDALGEFRSNLSAGIILMLANWSSILLVSSARMVIEWRWGELVFGKVSFAFSLTNIFLTFVTAISVVLFPSLKRIEGEKLPQMYKDIRELISPLLFLALMLFFPGSWIVEMWLPNYAVSLEYLAILLPIIIFSSKVSLLTNNYLKVYRKEKSMLIVNLISVAVGFGLFALCAYVFDHLIALLVCVVFVMMLNSILSEIVVMRVIRVRIIKEFIYEAALTVGFILIASYLNLLWGFLAYLCLYLLYCACNFKAIAALCKRIFRRRVKKPVEAEGLPMAVQAQSAAGTDTAAEQEAAVADAQAQSDTVAEEDASQSGPASADGERSDGGAEGVAPAADKSSVIPPQT